MIDKLPPQRLVGKSQAYFWSAEWQTAEQEASADIAAGRVRRFEDVDALSAELEGEVMETSEVFIRRRA